MTNELNWYGIREALDAKEAECERRAKVGAFDGELDRLGEEAAELLDQLMTMSAPDADAAMWKIDRLLEVEGVDEFTGSWSAARVAQPLADLRRFLGEPVHA